jgi:hypothetical protein
MIPTITRTSEKRVLGQEMPPGILPDSNGRPADAAPVAPATENRHWPSATGPQRRGQAKS